jgi:transcriptional regulator with XRE-family HTH domain
MYPNLKLAIFKKGLRQNHLAREVGIHEVILSKIIHGYREPSAEQKARLSQYLNASESWLFEKYAAPVAEIARTETQEREYGES